MAEPFLLRRARIKEATGGAIAVAGCAMSGVAILVLVIESVEWLTSAEWPGLTLADGLSLFGVHHEAAESDHQRYIDLLLAVPLSMALFATGLVTIFAGISLVDREAERRVRSELRSRSPLGAAALLVSEEVSALQFLRLVVLGSRLRIAGTLAAGGLAGGLLLYILGAGAGS